MTRYCPDCGAEEGCCDCESTYHLSSRGIEWCKRSYFGQKTWADGEHNDEKRRQKMTTDELRQLVTKFESMIYLEANSIGGNEIKQKADAIKEQIISAFDELTHKFVRSECLPV